MLPEPRAGWGGTESGGSQPPDELKRRGKHRRKIWHATGEDVPERQDRGDWWRVAAMVAAVLCGSALALYALIEWATGM